ncbi:MAG: MmcQ/YjbR family DNA-binding protein [Chloroflexi bacterium]|nr:MmcQ/YjbR family DNA-binding protein [Chloroflexota bacterium]
MVTADDAREMALSFPGTEERSHFGAADFRVRGKIYATLPSADRLVVWIDPNDQSTLLSTFPTTFEKAAGSWGLRGWTNVRLGLVDPDMLLDLLIESWRRQAGKRAVEAFEDERRRQASLAEPAH